MCSMAKHVDIGYLVRLQFRAKMDDASPVTGVTVIASWPLCIIIIIINKDLDIKPWG